MALIAGTCLTAQAVANPVVVNLKAVWNANPETDLLGYEFNNYTLNGSVTNIYYDTANLKFDLGSTNPSILPATPQILLFPYTFYSDVPVGTVGFKMRAVNINAVVGALSTEAIYNYNIDMTPPAAVTGLVISKP
jgi:hypothetical protein